MSPCHTPTTPVATPISTLIGNQPGVPCRPPAGGHARASSPNPRAQNPTAEWTAMPVKLAQPKAALDPNENSSAVANPTAETVEPIRPNVHVVRPLTLLVASKRLTELKTK